MNSSEIVTYYNALTPEQRLNAFVQMVEELEMSESLAFSENADIYWTTTGNFLGDEE